MYLSIFKREEIGYIKLFNFTLFLIGDNEFNIKTNLYWTGNKIIKRINMKLPNISAWFLCYKDKILSK